MPPEAGGYGQSMDDIDKMSFYQVRLLGCDEEEVTGLTKMAPDDFHRKRMTDEEYDEYQRVKAANRARLQAEEMEERRKRQVNLDRQRLNIQPKPPTNQQQ